MITVIGAGKVGSAAAFDILRYKISDVVLIDTNEKAAKGRSVGYDAGGARHRV